ncbi:MAG: DUF5915 domain-containing protein, partial [Flavobacteriaceae bacterium]|nr:DUF5915 domain-containing protein [Flavobacteriaceae bacterium]
LVANQGNLTVALDITITDELRNEGYARELVNRIQNLRKESGFDVIDKIRLTVQKHELLDKAIKENEQYIKNETLTNELISVEQLDKGTEIVFDEVSTYILIEKL